MAGPVVVEGVFIPIVIGETASLHTYASDPDSVNLTYTWSILSKESLTGEAITNSTAKVVANGDDATFKPDKVGCFSIACTVSDGVNEATSYHVVQVIHRLYRAKLGTFLPEFKQTVRTQEPDEDIPVPPVTPATRDLPGWKSIYYEDFNVNCAEGQFLQTYPRMKVYPINYTTTHGGTAGANNGDHYGGNTNLSVANSILTARLYREAPGTCLTANNPKGTGHAVGACPYPIYSADPNDMAFQYGRVAVKYRARNAVPGHYSALMMWPKSEIWPRDGEIDFLEGGLNGTANFNLHRQGATAGNDQDHYGTSVTYTDWHTVVLEWSPSRIKIFIDGVLLANSTNRIPNTPMRLALQLETGQSGTQPGAAPATTYFDFDYIAVWKYAP